MKDSSASSTLRGEQLLQVCARVGAGRASHFLGGDRKP